MDADILNSARLLFGYMKSVRTGIELSCFRYRVLGSESEMVGYATEITRPTANILNPGEEVLSSDVKCSRTSAEKEI